MRIPISHLNVVETIKLA